MRFVSVEVTYPQSDPFHAVFETVAYTTYAGPEMIRFRCREEKDDLAGAMTVAFSGDHGDSWGDEQTWPAGEKREGGVYRQYWGYPVAVGNLTLLVGADGVFRNDHALDGMTQYVPRYRVSDDGGRTWIVDEPVIQAGDEFDAAHPFPNVWVGRNAVMPANTPLVLRDGRVLVPCNVTTLGEDGNYFCPKGAYTYTAAGILEGWWLGGGRVEWTLRDPVRLKPEQSIRGAIEPTLAEMPDGRILMVLRANAGTADPQSGYKWFCVSSDKGKSWSRPWPWTFSDGTPMYSPSSISQLFRHSSGDWYWIGNICLDPPTGNNPRYPLVIGRVDPVSLRLDVETLDVLDTKRDGDTEALQLSNFTLYENRRTGNVVLRLTRRDGGVSGGTEPIRASVVAYTLDL